jgi:DNA-binding response OmpR family regulator
VLFVDDDEDLCVLVQVALVERGFDVVTASSFEEATEAAASRVFDVVVTDVHLNGHSGLDLCRRFRDSAPRLPVIVLSGNSLADVHASGAGAAEFLVKPVEFGELEAAIMRVVMSALERARPT